MFQECFYVKYRRRNDWISVALCLTFTIRCYFRHLKCMNQLDCDQNKQISPTGLSVCNKLYRLGFVLQEYETHDSPSVSHQNQFSYIRFNYNTLVQKQFSLNYCHSDDVTLRENSKCCPLFNSSQHPDVQNMRICLLYRRESSLCINFTEFVYFVQRIQRKNKPKFYAALSHLVCFIFFLRNNNLCISFQCK